jgi:predicted dehydrogenase
MLAAAKAADRRLLVGHVLPFFPEFALLADAARTEKYGKLLAGQFERVIARPDWSTAIADSAQTGGPAIDLHIHDTHFIRMICGMPKEVFATGVVDRGTVVHVNSQYRFESGGPSIVSASGALCQPGRPFMHGYEIYFERGTLVYQSGVLPPTLYTAEGGTERPALPGSGDAVDCFAAELQAVVDGVSADRNPPELDGRLARDALALCHFECEAVQSGLIVKVSGGSPPA